jgi:hypothetical protein
MRNQSAGQRLGMDVPTPPAQIEVMKTLVLFAGILAARVSALAGDTKPANVTVYVNADHSPPSSVDQRARTTVTWMFARAGVHVVWRDGESSTISESGSPVVIQVRFTRDVPDGASRDALACALPFGGQRASVHVFYDRIRFVAGRSTREAPLLAHALAHEIGHVLQVTNQHAMAGVMKAHWNGRDYDAMERKPLEFTSLDVDLIKDGLNMLTARSARPRETLR